MKKLMNAIGYKTGMPPEYVIIAQIEVNNYA
jgi:hypothetical protein